MPYSLGTLVGTPCRYDRTQLRCRRCVVAAHVQDCRVEIPRTYLVPIIDVRRARVAFTGHLKCQDCGAEAAHGALLGIDGTCASCAARAWEERHTVVMPPVIHPFQAEEVKEGLYFIAGTEMNDRDYNVEHDTHGDVRTIMALRVRPVRPIEPAAAIEAVAIREDGMQLIYQRVVIERAPT